MSQETLITLGIEAENLLQNPTFTEVVNDLTNYYLQGIIESKPEQEIERKNSYLAIKALQDIVSILNQRVGVKSQIEQALEDQGSTYEDNNE
jgi:gamma-glutamyl:cysteine ligase YbdK (ATP-grasp superfamily)